MKWYQFKVPVSQFENVIGGIEGFNSIRFMRVYMKGFNKPVVSTTGFYFFILEILKFSDYIFVIIY